MADKRAIQSLYSLVPYRGNIPGWFGYNRRVYLLSLRAMFRLFGHCLVPLGDIINILGAGQ